MRRGLRLPSGRVIAIGRYMLAMLFLFAVWFDLSPLFDPTSNTAKVLGAYVLFSLAVVMLTWNDWWLDARISGPAHAVDIAVFTALVATTEGSDSPYFTFFTFVILAAAIRWGWRVTALTAVLLISLYMLAGMVLSGSTLGSLPKGDELHVFIDRTGHLVILSLILIWFGINHWRFGLPASEKHAFDDPALDDAPLETSLTGAMAGLSAGRGVLVWREQGETEAEAIVATEGQFEIFSIKGRALEEKADRPFLYNLPKNRALSRDDRRNLDALQVADLIHGDAARTLKLSEGIAIPLRTASGEGELFLEQFRNLSTDHIDFGADLANEVVGHIERHALILAVEESAEARSRLTLARDLHDSVVQFLAGAAFRLEALKRDQAAGRNLEPELNHLKQLMLEEQGELRSFIAALRSAPKIDVRDLAKDLEALSARLAKQWDVLCEFTAHTSDMVIPTRLQLDAQHLIREAVANAVRHAGAKTVTIRLRAEGEELLFDIINDGARYPDAQFSGDMPRSLSERVKLAGGDLELTRGMGVTRISVSLPISGRVH